ncbi:MAG: M61 family metallopeptidase [Polymorphobacter sp.]|uniref:M61 family metallopeptidase n=1 Tax=Polymorphobacter sp. TaxID=1909290 RepID=UPI003A8AD162
MLKPLLTALLISTAAAAQAPRSLPTPTPYQDPIPQARDIPYPGIMQIAVDATNSTQGIYSVTQTIPVPETLPVPGKLTLLFPKWLPGKHAARGEVEKLARLEITAGGQKLPWTRDPQDVFAFTVSVPAGATSLTARFNFLSATQPDQGRITATSDIINLQPNQVSLYPAGWFTRQIPASLTVTWPQGWQAAGALRPAATQAGSVTYETVDYETLVDSPFFAGRHFQSWDLGENVTLNVVADEPTALAATPEAINAHKRLVTQSLKTFGAKHFDHYDFLLALTTKLGGIGLEHHRASENSQALDYFTGWSNTLRQRGLLPHEFTHSWNGKFRRGQDSITPDFRTPLINSMLWVYEGQTQFWGYILAARSGMTTPEATMEALASLASTYDTRPGRQWRPLIDTTNDPVITPRAPKGWRSEQRSEDYYSEGLLIWLEIDAMIREQTRGRRGMDDFAKAFFGQRDGDWGEQPYTMADIVTTLNDLAPHDWQAHLTARLTETTPRAPLGGFTRSGYTLEYTDEQPKLLAAQDRASGGVNLIYSGGLATGKDGAVTAVDFMSPAFAAGLNLGDTILAVNDKPYTPALLKAAITAAKGSDQPIRLLVKTRDRTREAELLWNQGLRYPILKRTGSGKDWLADLLKPR